MSKTIEIAVVQGREGACLLVNDSRVAGPKPWGGGMVSYRWTTTAEEIVKAITQSGDSPSEIEDAELREMIDML